MPTYGGTVNVPILPNINASVSNYSPLDETDVQLLAYSGTFKAPIKPNINSSVSNYKLAFSTSTPSIHPSIGQLWPRGAGDG